MSLQNKLEKHSVCLRPPQAADFPKEPQITHNDKLKHQQNAIIFSLAQYHNIFWKFFRNWF